MVHLVTVNFAEYVTYFMLWYILFFICVIYWSI